MTDGTITFDTAIDNKGLLKDIEKQKKIIENSTKKIQSLELKKGSLSAEAERLGEELERSGNELAAIQGQINGKKEIGLKATREETAEYNAALRANNRIVDALNKQDAKLRDIDAQIAAEQGNISSATQRAAELNDKVKRQPEAWKKAKAAAGSLMKRLGTMIKRLFVFSVILAGLRKVKEYFSSVLKNNTEFQASVAKMKGAWQTAFQPVVEWVMPILMKLMDFLTKIGYTIAAIFARFTGKTVGGLKASAKAATDTTKAVKGLNKQMKQLASFDEMNVLSDSSSGSNAEAAAAPAATYDFDTSGIEANLDKIIEIAAGALLAVGLILTMFGHWAVGIPLMAAGAALLIKDANTEGTALNEWITQNLEAVTSGLVIGGMIAIVLGLLLAFTGSIPLGIALIGIGAAALYEAAELNGGIDKLLEENLQTITSALVIAGLLAVALGIILMCTENLPLGVALIALGVGGLVSAVSLNWDTIANALKGPIGAVTAVVSLAFLALGALLCFAVPAALPLGLGLLVVGAAGLAATAAVNWETIKQKLQGPLGKVVAIVSVALLALGAILCFAVPGALPLGLGLLAAGAVGLAATVAVNWETVKQKIRTVVSSILAIASGALLAMGVLLCLTGAGLPLGLGLIAAGLAGTVLANKLDDNPITRAVKNMVNGLIGIIEGFINKIISGVNWLVDQINKIGFTVPDWVPGIGGKRFGFSISHVSKVTLPRLAEGAVIPANREFLAVLGDQKTGTNIETPLATMVEAFRTAMETYGGGDVTIPIFLDGKQIARHVININQQRQFASNY